MSAVIKRVELTEEEKVVLREAAKSLYEVILRVTKAHFKEPVDPGARTMTAELLMHTLAGLQLVHQEVWNTMSERWARENGE